MAETKGRDFLLKIGDGATTELFNTVGGFRSNGLTINNETVDTTTKSSAPWRKLVNAGIRSMSVSGAGIFNDGTYEEDLRALADSGELNNFQLFDVTTGDYYEGAFQVTSYERTSEYNGVVNFSVSLESSGTIAFTEA